MGSTRRRLRWALAAVLIALVFGSGWFAARRFQSPAQREAAARPPAAGPLFVPVAKGVLSDRVSGTGSVDYERLDPITSARGGVVTARRQAAGAQVGSGSVLTEIESRPVFVFAGRFPFYRDLARGDRGADVAQLQAGLRAAGHPVPRGEAGSFGAATAAAVAALYRAAGYSPPAGLPLAELSMAAGLPATVSGVPAVGARLEAGGVVATLAHGRLVARVSLDAAAFTRVDAGQRATVTGAGIGGPLAGRVASLSPGGAHGDPEATIAFGTPPRPSAAGRTAVVTITIQAVAHPGLIVPSRAIADGADGTAQVVIETGSTRHAVAVRVLGSLDGRNVIEAKAPSGSLLRPGASVQVG